MVVKHNLVCCICVCISVCENTTLDAILIQCIFIVTIISTNFKTSQDWLFIVCVWLLLTNISNLPFGMQVNVCKCFHGVSSSILQTKLNRGSKVGNGNYSLKPRCERIIPYKRHSLLKNYFYFLKINFHLRWWIISIRFIISISM